MILIGEKINSSNKRIRRALEERDEAFLCNIIKTQEKNGADYIDVNTAVCSDEKSSMEFVVSLIKENSSCNISIDSQDPGTLLYGAKLANGRRTLINSLSLKNDISDYSALISFSVNLPTRFVLMPDPNLSCEQTLVHLQKAISYLSDYGINNERILIDIVVRSLAYEPNAATMAKDAIRIYKTAFPECLCIGGASNISFGMPQRHLLNNALIVTLASLGADALIADLNNESTCDIIAATTALYGDDEAIIDYIVKQRERV